MVGKPLPTSSDAGTGIDVIASLLGHKWVSSSQVYVHPDPARLREAVDRVPSPLTDAAVTRWARHWRLHLPVTAPAPDPGPGWRCSSRPRSLLASTRSS